MWKAATHDAGELARLGLQVQGNNGSRIADVGSAIDPDSGTWELGVFRKDGVRHGPVLS